MEDKLNRVPYDVKDNYSREVVQRRLQWLSERTGRAYEYVTHYSGKPEDCRGNTDNFIGAAQVPVGLMGPLLVHGDHAKGEFFVPFATTEGALIETYQRGALAITKSGGVKVFINQDANHLDPVFIFNHVEEAKDFLAWVRAHKDELTEVAQSTTSFGKLVGIKPVVVGRRVILDFSFHTTDAMGANMINIATEKVCNYINEKCNAKRYLLRSNFSSEKKASGVNMINGYGKEVVAEAIIDKKVVKRFLFTTPEEICRSWNSWVIASISSNMVGINAHFANGLAAMFIACGQDVAHITNACVGLTIFELNDDGDLVINLKLPNIIVGTVGGGTGLVTQRECLEMIGCYGRGKVSKFAEIVGAALVAGELGICSGITSVHFLDPHKRAREHTRQKAFVQKE